MRKNFEMSVEQLGVLLDAGKPTRVMKIGNSVGSTPQENANRAWEALGKEMGFKYMTVKPLGNGNQRAFSAEVIE